MALGAAMIPEFDQEQSNTRKVLERVKDEKFSWKPHDKSPTMGWLAGHLANIPSWVAYTMDSDSIDVAPAPGEKREMPIPANKAEALAMFDKNVAEARARLATATDEQLMAPWSLLNRGATLMTMPKIAVVRGWVISHSIHHRAQLGVYLRLNDIAVPAIYGPSADESPF